MNNTNLLGRAIKALALTGFCFLLSTNAGAQALTPLCTSLMPT